MKMRFFLITAALALGCAEKGYIQFQNETPDSVQMTYYRGVDFQQNDKKTLEVDGDSGLMEPVEITARVGLGWATEENVIHLTIKGNDRLARADKTITVTKGQTVTVALKTNLNALPDERFEGSWDAFAGSAYQNFTFDKSDRAVYTYYEMDNQIYDLKKRYEYRWKIEDNKFIYRAWKEDMAEEGEWETHSLTYVNSAMILIGGSAYIKQK